MKIGILQPNLKNSQKLMNMRGYLPSYHPEYNPIELAWVRIKEHIGRNPSYTVKSLLENKLPEAFDKLTPRIIGNMVDHTIAKIQEDILCIEDLGRAREEISQR